MEEWLRSLVPWGTDAILWAQSASPTWLDAVWRFLTALGYEEFYLALLPLIYWCVHKQVGVGLGYLVMLSTWANSLVKHAAGIPRPTGVTLKAPRAEVTPSFPSNHAQATITNWGYLAYRFRRGWLWVLAVALSLGIGLSRIVLGVHFPQDVIGGWSIGLFVLVIYAWAAPPLGRWIGRQRMPVQLLVAVAVPAGLIFLHPAEAGGHYPAEDALTTMSGLVGLGVGLVMERAWVRFAVAGEWWRRGQRFLLGLAIVAALYAGPKLILPDEMAAGVEAVVRFVRFALLAWATVFGCPWLFVRLRLAGQEGAT